MDEYKVGDKSKGICYGCKKYQTDSGIVPTTFLIRDLPIEGRNVKIKNMLVGVCNICGGIASIPHQTVIKAQKMLNEER